MDIAGERKRRGLSQAHLAARCGLTQADISRIERGQRPLSLPEASRFATILDVPLQWFLTGKVRPGTDVAELAVELRRLGLVDLLVSNEQAPGAFRPTEEVLALVVGVERPEPRVIEAAPALLAWNSWRVDLLQAFAQATHPRALTRLAWLAEIAWALEREGSLAGGMSSGDQIAQLLATVNQPRQNDDLGHPSGAGPVHRIWTYWHISYAATLVTFRERATQLHELRKSLGTLPA